MNTYKPDYKMHIKKAFSTIAGLCLFLFSNGQTIPTVTRVDENLSLVFPGEIQHTDTLGITLYQSAQDKITYQVVKKVKVIDIPGKSAWKESIDQAAEVYKRNPRFKDFQKQAKDTTIGNTMGKYIQMTGIDHGQTMRLFVFVTFENADIYSVQITSFANDTITRQSLRWFYSHLQFKGISY